MANRNPKQYVAAYKPHTNTFGGTEVTVGVGTGMLIQSDGRSVSTTQQKVVETDTPFTAETDKTQHTADMDPKGYFRYDPSGGFTMMSHAMGDVSTVSTVTDAVTTAYEKTLRPAEDIAGLYGTFAVDKGARIYSYPSLKPYGFTITGESGANPLMIVYHGLGSHEVGDAGVNTATVFAGVTYDDRKNRITYDDLTFRMNDDGGATLAASDNVKPLSFEVMFKRAFDPYWADTNYREEPVDDDAPEFVVKMTFPRHSATEAALIADYEAETLKKIEIAASGALFATGGTMVRAMEIQATRCVFAEAPDHGFDGGGRPTVSFTWWALDRTNEGGADNGFRSALPMTVFFRHLRITAT